MYFLLPGLAGYDKWYADACACDGAFRDDWKAYCINILDLVETSSGIPNIPVKGSGLHFERMKFMEERIYNYETKQCCSWPTICNNIWKMPSLIHVLKNNLF